MKNKTLNMVYVAMFAVIIAICSWITVPTLVPFTMQTFAVFLAVGVLGGKRGSLAVLIYILLGVIGIPVFSGFRGGLGVLLGVTGGYILGFLFLALFMWGVEVLFGKKTWIFALSMVLGLFICYAFGTVWFMVVYAGNSGEIALMTVLGKCVFPFLIPDFVKMALVLLIRPRLVKIIKIED